VLLHKAVLLLIVFKVKNLPHTDLNCVHSPFKHDLLFFYLLIHEISAEEENYLGIKSFLTNLFDKTPHLIDFNLVSIAIFGPELLLHTSIVKHDLACGNLEEYVSSSFSRVLSHREVLEFC